MTHSIEGSVADILGQNNAHAHERWADDFNNVWEIHEDRDGLSLYAVEGNATIPYWTTYVVQLPGLHRM